MVRRWTCPFWEPGLFSGLLLVLGSLPHTSHYCRDCCNLAASWKEVVCIQCIFFVAQMVGIWGAFFGGFVYHFQYLDMNPWDSFGGYHFVRMRRPPERKWPRQMLIRGSIRNGYGIRTIPWISWTCWKAIKSSVSKWFFGFILLMVQKSCTSWDV